MFRTAITIRKRIIIAAVIQAIVICLICGFGYISFKAVLTKLQAIEIIDDVNISFLEMRKAEKNYFLYQDQGSLEELLQIGKKRYEVLQASRSYLVSGLHGLSYEEYASLLHNLRHYLELIQQALLNKRIPPQSEAEIRKLGHELTEQSPPSWPGNGRPSVISSAITLLCSLSPWGSFLSSRWFCGSIFSAF